MPRDSSVYLEDIRGAIAKVNRYIGNASREAFAADDKTMDAVVRNLEVIGEAVKRLPLELRARRPDIEWQAVPSPGGVPGTKTNPNNNPPNRSNQVSDDQFKITRGNVAKLYGFEL